jgi:hypothetical protein
MSYPDADHRYLMGLVDKRDQEIERLQAMIDAINKGATEAHNITRAENEHLRKQIEILSAQLNSAREAAVQTHK